MLIRPVQLFLALILVVSNFAVLAESVNKKDDTTVTLTDLIDKLKGSGVTITSPAFVAEDNAQAGIFSGYGFLLGDDVDEGVVFSTGDVDDVVGTNSADNTSTAFNTTLNNTSLFGAVRDLVTLSFNVVPDENTLIVEYVFGSEEYNEFVNGGFNDFIRIFVGDDVAPNPITYSNCAVTANGLIVSIDAVNNGSNSFLYKDNDFGDFNPNFPFNTEMDGFTRTVSCRFPVTPGANVNVVIGMADDGDANFDSWVFFKAQSLRSEPSDEFGDAPDTYQTLALSNGAAHTIIEGVYLGTTPSGDQNGFVDGVDDSAGNAADDSSDDGVLTFSTLDADLSTNYSVTINATSINAKGARFIGWIDFDGDGQFQTDEASSLATLATDQYETDVTLNWPTISGAGPDIVMGSTFARIRMVNDDEIISSGDFAGILLSGEVEDYKFQITGAGDVTPSVVTIDTLPTATSSIIATYPVTGTCTAGDGNVDVAVAGATPANQSVVCNGGGTWTASFDVTAIGDGAGVISVTVTQSDSRGNSGNAGPSLADKDVTPPTIDIQNEPVNVNSTAAFNVTFEFDEDVTGFSLGEIAVVNASVSNFVSVDANTYTADITPDGTGNITIDVAANVAQDSVNNNNTAATQEVVVFDNVNPVVAITSAPVANAGNVAAYPVSGTCTIGDGNITVAISGATPANQSVTCTAGGAWSATFDVSAIVDGTNAISVDASQTDTASNTGNAVTVQADKESDVPTVDIQGEPVISNLTPYNVTIEFNEDVTGFISGDVTVGNGSVTGFTAVDGNTYTAQITPAGTGNITVDVAANVAQDGAANNNTAATQAVTVLDIVVPGVDIQGEPAIVNSTATFNVTIEFSENVTGFVAGDVTVGNGSITGFAAVDGNTYTVQITPDGVGDVSIDVAGGVAVDIVNNNNSAATQAVTTFDNAAPTVDIQGEPAIVNSTVAFNVTVEFSEDVTGFVAGDVSVGNGSVTNFTAVDGNTYTVEITPNGAGNITIDVAANVAIDVASNNNAAAAQATTAFDNAAPTVDVQGEPAIVNSTTPFNVTIEFSEDVTGFVTGDVSVGNASVTNFTPVDGNTYTVEITPDGLGDVTVDVAANVAIDVASNNNTAATQAITSFDNTAPTVDIQGEPATVNSTTPFNVTVEFSENVTGFVAGDVSIVNGAVTSFTVVDGNTYTVEVTPNGSGDVSIDVAANTAIDTAGNNNVAATQALVTFDNAKPTVDIQGEPVTNSLSAFNVTVEFSENVVGFTSGEVSVGNGSVTNFTAVDGNTYTVEITPDGGGDITIDVAADVAQDTASNTNTAAAQAIIVLDNVSPTVDIQGEPMQVNSLVAFNVSFEFSETVTGFVLGDISVGNGAASNFIAVDGNTYTADITPTGAGNITIDVAANVAQDAVSNGNTIAVQAVTSFDNAPPVVVITSAPNINASNEVAYPVSGTCTVGDGDVLVSVTAAPLAPLTSTVACTAGGTWSVSFNVSGLNDGATIDINAEQTDAASNQGVAITIQVEKDVVVPTVDIQGEPGIVNSVTPFNITAEFSEDVIGFDASDVTVSNGSATNVAPVDGNTYTVEITPNGVGALTIDIAANRAQDGTGNGNTSATQANVAFDSAVPSVDIQGEPGIVNSTAPFNVTVEFSEDVTEFVTGDVSVGNGSVTNFSPVDGNTYTVEITPDGNGDITVDVAANVAIDAASNNNTAASQAVTSFDNTAPTVDIQGEPVIVNSTAPFNITVEFSEDVTGFVTGDVSVGNGSVTNFTPVDGNTYTVEITPDGNGDISIDVAANVVIDAASNNNTAAIQAVVTFDNTPPTVDIQGEPASVNSTATYNITIEFSEDVTEFVTGDVSVVNGSVTNFTSIDGNTYTVEITPDGNGDITVDVAANVAIDAASNNNAAAAQATTAFDNAAPTVDVQGEPAIVNSTTPFNVTIEFSEDVTGFVTGDVSVGNASVTNFTPVDGNTYTVEITPDGNGDISIDVAANVAIDAASNNNTAAIQAVSTFDNTAPTVDIQGEPASVNSTATYNITIEFSEDVTGFVIGDITVGNGAASNFVTVDANTYTADITPSGAGDITIDVAANVAIDGANNNNTAATQAVSVFDNTAPTVDIQNEPATSNASAFNVTFEFNEDVTGFVIGDITVANAATSNFVTVDTNTYTADITPDGLGSITIDVAGSVAQDLAGNNNTAATQAVVTFVNDSDNDGILDSVECPAGPPLTVPNCPDADGDGIPDVLETDSDNDGIPDADEVGPDPDSPVDTDNDGIPDYQDTDSDGDGISDAIEGVTDTDGDGIPDYVDIGDDFDGDGIPDGVECPAYPNCPDTDGDGQPDYADTDADGDGIPDANEAGVDPAQPLDTDGDGTPDYQDTDSDNDGTDDSVEVGGDPLNPVDTDGDGIPDYVDFASAGPGAGDSDGDGIADNIECALYPLCADTDGDGTPDYMEVDSDNDGILDAVEANTAIADIDNDGIDDNFDIDNPAFTPGVDVLDENGDGIIDTRPLDSDGDGTPNYQDTDSDNDGVADAIEGTVDTDSDLIPDYLDIDFAGPGPGDSDGDGINDDVECPAFPACPDSDGDGKPDYLDSNDTDGPLGDTDNDGRLNFTDPDDDNDGIPDSVEDFNTDSDNNPFTNPNDTDGDGVPDYRDTDSDDDGINDTVDSGLIEPLVDTDGDGLFDSYDVSETGGTDANADGIDDAVQPKDDDNDGIFDQLDADVATDGTSGDSDGDGIPDDVECTSFPVCEDTDNDGVPDYLDDDADNDGIPDAVEIGQLDSGIIADSDGDGIPDFKDTDSDNDGILDADEGVVDSDGDGIPDYVDPESSGLPNGGDSDGDGVEDRGECSNYPACADSDNDGVPDYLDADSRPYDPNDEINTGLKGVGSNNAAYLLLLLFMIITLRHSFFRRGLFLFALSFSAQSEEASQFESNWYIGFGLGVTELSPDTNNTGFSVSDDKDTGWKLFGGYDYSEALSFEGFYSDLGVASLSNQGNVLLNPNGEIDYSILGGSVLWYFWHDKKGEEYTMRRGWQTFINGGLSMLDNSANVDFSQNNSVQIHFGAGVEYGWDNGFMVRAGLDTFDKDATLISINLIKRFGIKSKSKKLKRKEPAERTKIVPAKIIPAAPVIVSYDVDDDADGVNNNDDLCPDTRANVAVNAEGCSIFQAALEGINFENNSAEIKSESTSILDKTARALISEPGIRVEVQAHTDSVGSKKYNQKLSEKRATSVREYLISKGVATTQLESKGYGESSPVLSNDNAEGRARNRRVELKVLEEKAVTN